MKLGCNSILILIHVILLISAKNWFDSRSSDLRYIFPAKNPFRLLTHYARGNRVILNSLFKDSQ